MLMKRNFLHAHLDFLPKNPSLVSNEQDDKFDLDMETMQSDY